MTLRTPRRRISPRTKRRYRAIRNFLRRAIGSASQQDIKIHSGIALNVSSLKRKIFGLEREVSEVNKACGCQQSGLENVSRGESESTLRTELEQEPEEHRGKKSPSPNYHRQYQLDSENLSDFSSEQNVIETNYERIEDEAKPEMNNAVFSDVSLLDTSCKKKISKHQLNFGTSHALLHSPSITTYENRVNAYSTTSVEVANSKRNYKVRRSHQRPSRRDCAIDEAAHNFIETGNKLRDNKKQRTESPLKHFTLDRPKEKSKANIAENALDRDFIDDLIRRQYSPVRMFGRKSSEISQFTVPVCRDRLPTQRKNNDLRMQGDPDISSYYREIQNRPQHVQNNGLNNKRSVCDARLYGNNRRSRSKRPRNFDAYDSKYYDIIPVKEKASPKSRRKFAEDNLFAQNRNSCYDNRFAQDRSLYYVEVPPSPRSNRPRLNLTANYYDQYEDYFMPIPPVKKARSPMRVRKIFVPVETDPTSDTQDQEVRNQFRTRPVQSKQCMQEDLVQRPNEMYHRYSDVQDNVNINDTLVNKSQEACASDKTDKALCEIKDLLQNFLTEIKNTSLSKSDHCNLKNESIQACEKTLPPTAAGFQNFNPMHGHVSSTIPGPFLPPISNPCYPLLPMCPINMQPGYVMPTPSFTCTAGMNNCTCPTHKTSGNTPSKDNNEIDDLIKEIHKLVANKDQKSELRSNMEDFSARTTGLNGFSRSAGGSFQVQHQDAQVGTNKMRCYSKSCEAIGPKMVVEGYPSTSYSDTVLERMSLNPSIDTITSETKTSEKNIKRRFNVLLQSLGLLKKKKKQPQYAVEVISEADNRAYMEPHRQTPFRSDVTNYMMYGQEFTSPPPHLPRSPLRSPRHYCPYGDHENDFEKTHYSHCPMHEPTPEMYPRRSSPLRYERGRGHSPSAPPYSSSYLSTPYNVHAAQGPLCLREVEVKSIATQSEVQKPSFFAKFSKKNQKNLTPRMAYATQTSVPIQPPWKQQVQQLNQPQPLTKRQGFFGRKNDNIPQTFTPQPGPSKLDTWKYQLQMQQELAKGDQKIRNVLLKKIFSKRNPFSPRNPIIKTILGTDEENEAKYLKFGAVKPKILF